MANGWVGTFTQDRFKSGFVIHMKIILQKMIPKSNAGAIIVFSVFLFYRLFLTINSLFSCGQVPPGEEVNMELTFSTIPDEYWIY